MAKKKSSKKSASQVTETEHLSDQDRIKKAAQQIHEILAAAGLGMEAVIQIGVIQKGEKSPIQPKTVEQMARDAGIIVAGGEGDLPPNLVEMLKPIGDEIERK